MELIEKINQKTIELNNLQHRYDKQIEQEKINVLNSKSTGIKKSLYLLGFEFESSCSKTPQYLEFHKTFKKEFKKLLEPYIKEVSISKPNHFDISGFFKMKDEKIYYLSISDLRWSKDSMLIRTAQDFEDYTGGSNEYIKLDENFTENLFNHLGVE